MTISISFVGLPAAKQRALVKGFALGIKGAAAAAVQGEVLKDWGIKLDWTFPPKKDDRDTVVPVRTGQRGSMTWGDVYMQCVTLMMAASIEAGNSAFTEADVLHWQAGAPHPRGHETRDEAWSEINKLLPSYMKRFRDTLTDVGVETAKAKDTGTPKAPKTVEDRAIENLKRVVKLFREAEEPSNELRVCYHAASDALKKLQITVE